jgi:peptidoglycan/LPS O-acetylase OafA/YrhL
MHYVVIHVTFYFLRELLSPTDAWTKLVVYGTSALMISLLLAMLLYRMTERYYFSRKRQ